ncbi:MAG: U32 family peptidase [Clostridiales bacterium]|nr:U32 family peptidase [Clostridiales bacterium]
MSMKILSPAGDFESLKQAVYNGADEVYLGVKDFNARNIEGFSLATLKEAVEFAHIYDVKVHLTVNILFSDEEMQSALDLIVDAYNLGVDAFIIQDIGLMSIVHEYYPEIEIHASTQMGIHNLEGVRQVEKLGAKRVVLSRETPLEEVARIRANSDIEIEYFAQGALCVSFSGNCYLSSYLHDASGNRGKCKQLCRLPYAFKYEDKEIANGYLLSAKDICMLDRLEDLEKAGVTALKIEGRARRPYYVGVATKIYRKALNGEDFDIDELRLAFNRGYTAGYFDGNGDIISNRQNHIGIEIGRVEKFVKGKKFNEIFISSDREITPKSTIKFIYNNEEITISAYDISRRGGLYRITTMQTVEVGAKAYIISDFMREEEMKKFVFRRPVEISILAKIGEPIRAEISLKNHEIIIEGDVCEEAKNQPLTEKDFIDNFRKSELFDAILYCDINAVFMPKKSLNDFRRKVYDIIKNELIKTDRNLLNKISLPKYKEIEEIDSALDLYIPEVYNEIDIVKNKDKILYLPIFATTHDVEMLKQIVEKNKIPVLVNNLYALDFDTEKYIGGGMNVYNGYTAQYFGRPYFRAEGGEYQMPYMTLRHCPMKQHLGADCVHCPYREGYEYVMPNGKRMKLKRSKMSSCTFYLTN